MSINEISIARHNLFALFCFRSDFHALVQSSTRDGEKETHSLIVKDERREGGRECPPRAYDVIRNIATYTNSLLLDSE